jgi:putative FmdB family regulatory protein
MPTYEYRCPDGHTFDRRAKMSEAASELECPVCGKIATRQLSGGAALVFKGSGFYLTDYGKNAHRGIAPETANSGKNRESSDGDSKSGDKSGDSKPSESKNVDAKSSDTKSSDNKSGDSKSSDNKSSESKSSGTKSAESKGSDKSGGGSSASTSAPPKKSDS